MFLINSFKKAWRGEENIWVVLFLWHLIGNSFLTYLLFKIIDIHLLGINIVLVKIISGGVNIFFIYYLIYTTVSSWRCAGNVGWFLEPARSLFVKFLFRNAEIASFIIFLMFALMGILFLFR